MLRIKIIAVGKIKESYWNDAISEYTKRIQTHASLEIIEIKEESFSKKDNRETVKAKESENILKAIPENCYVIAMDETGKEFSSTEFSEKIESLKLTNSTISFIIGGALGLDKKIKKRADLTLSFSKMTFVHGMARVFLVEQIYRAFMISSGSTYHY